MALFQVTQGAVANAADVNQYYNLLTGATTDQPVTIANRIRATNTGAATNSGYMGGTAGGPPTSGTFATGDTAIDTVYGNHWTCTTAGTPGTWVGSYTPIFTTTLGVATNTITWSSIPQKFSHLEIFVLGQLSAAAFNVDFSLQFNADSGAHYNNLRWDADNGTPAITVSNSNNQTSVPQFGALPGTSYISSPRVGMVRGWIPAYTGTSLPKIVKSSAYMTDAGTAYNVHERWGYWSQTSAITQIVLNCGSGNFTAGSYFGLYGMP